MDCASSRDSTAEGKMKEKRRKGIRLIADGYFDGYKLSRPEIEELVDSDWLEDSEIREQAQEGLIGDEEDDDSSMSS